MYWLFLPEKGLINVKLTTITDVFLMSIIISMTLNICGIGFQHTTWIIEKYISKLKKKSFPDGNNAILGDSH